MLRLSQSPTEEEFVQDPYPFYEQARKSGHLFYWADLGKICAVSSEAVNLFLRDRRWGREVPAEFVKPVPSHTEPFEALERHSMLQLDPPHHTRLRSLVNRAFTTRHVQRREDEIRQLANLLLDDLQGKEVDLQHEYAEQLPVMVIARLLGVPLEMCGQFLSWSHAMVGMYQANRNLAAEHLASRAASEFSEYMKSEIGRRRSNLADDLISSLISAVDRDDRLSTEEIVSNCILLLNAGHEATTFSIGNGIWAILNSDLDPARLLAPDARESTVEEILRFDPPLHIFERIAKEDVEHFGARFRRGDAVAVILAAANRDPSVYGKPAKFDPEGNASVHASFGAGIHFCVGAPLARLEIGIALETLFRRYPGLQVTESPRYADRYHFHGLDSLRARL